MRAHHPPLAFRDTAELLAAVRVSCTVPLIGGAPPSYRGGVIGPVVVCTPDSRRMRTL